MYSPVRITAWRLHRNQHGRVAQQIVEVIEKFLRKPEPRVTRAAPGDLLAHQHVPARLDLRKRAHGRALHLGNDSAELKQDALLLRFGELRPSLLAECARNAGDHQIRPAVALAFDDDFGNRHRQPSAKLRQRRALRDELPAQQRRKNLQDQAVVEPDHEDWCRWQRHAARARQAVAARDVERCRQAARRVEPPGVKALVVREDGELHRYRSIRDGAPAHLSGPDWRARTGAAGGCRVRPRHRARPAPISCPRTPARARPRSRRAPARTSRAARRASSPSAPSG